MGFLGFSGALAGSRYPATPQSRSSSPLPIRQRAGVLFEIAIRSLCQGPRQPRTDPAGGATAALRQRNPANARSAFVRTAGGANGANAPPDRGFLLGGLSNASTFWVTRNWPLDKIRNVPDRWPNAFWIATCISGIVVFCQLWAIAWLRARFKDTPFLRAAFQVIIGGGAGAERGNPDRRILIRQLHSMLLKLLLAVLEAHPAGRRGTASSCGP